jgi:purine-binding chemotaxis protein CheW
MSPGVTDWPTPEANDMSGACLLCRIGSRVCALPLRHVSETMRPLPIEPLAGMPPFVRGLSIIRGAPTPVVDGTRLVGGTDQEQTSRFVTVKVGERRVALAVDAVIGVRTLPAHSLEALPPLLREGSQDFVSAIGTLDSDLLLMLRSARLVPESVWAAIDTEGACR